MLLDPEMLREEILSEKKDSKRKKKPKEGVLRAAGGETWIDDKMDVWPANDFRIFVGNLGPEVRPSVTRSHVVCTFTQRKRHHAGAEVTHADMGREGW